MDFLCSLTRCIYFKDEEKANKLKKESAKTTNLKEGKKTIPKHESKIGITLVHEESQG